LSSVHAVPVSVDLELCLLVDVSGSVSGGEFDTQRDGYEAAFRDSDIIDAIMNGPDHQAIAVQLVYWASYDEQAIGVDWTLINDSASSNAFADAVAGASRPYSGATAVGRAIEYAMDTNPANANSNDIFSNDFAGTRLVLDVSGDGTDNDSDQTSPFDNAGYCAAARDAAMAAGITSINGLVISTDTSVYDFYEDYVIAGATGFVVQVDDFTGFAPAVSSKILREIEDPGDYIPEPMTLALFGSAVVGLVVRRRRKK
jgi:hypothetical protein